MWRVSPTLAALSALAVLSAACGGEGEAAPRPPERQRCPSTDEQLAGLYALLDEGRLAHLGGVLESELDADARGDLVAALIRLVGAFEPGTFTALGGLAGAVDDAGGVMGLLADVIRWLTDEGPGAPYPAALGAARGLLQTCEGPPVLQLVSDVLADDALLAAVLALLDTPQLAETLGGLEIDGEAGKPAVRALARNVLVAAGAPTFDVGALLELLAVVVDLEAPPWDTIDAGLRRLLGPGPSLQALQALMGCVLAVDEDLALVDLVFELLTDPSLELAGALSGLLPAADPANPAAPLIPTELAGLLGDALTFLIGDAPARVALAEVLTRMLGDAQAPGVLRDVADLLEADVLGDIVGLLTSLATRTCPP